MMRLLCLVAALTAGTATAATLEEGVALKKQQRLAEAETVLAEVVREHPDDTAALGEWATVLGWLGRFDDSIAAWSRALERRPDDPDVLLPRARVEYWKGDAAAARHDVDAVLAAAPDRADALVLAGDICTAAKDAGCARDRYRHAQAIAPSAEIERKLEASAGPPRVRLDAGGQLDGYDTARGTEGSFFAQASVQALDSLVVSGGYEQLHQFGAVDHRVNLGAYLVPVAPLLLTARVAISPTADTVAPWEASGGVELHVVGPLTGLANVRHMEFPNQGVTIVGGGARLDVGVWSFAAQGGVVHSTTADLQGFGALRVETGLSERVRAYAGFARGAQAQLLLPTATATDVTAGVLWQIDRTFGVRADYTYERFGDFYVRNSLGTALTVRF